MRYATIHNATIHNVYTHKSLSVSQWAGSVSHSVICPMRHPGILFSLHPQSRRGEQRTSQLRRIMVNATCGAAAALAHFDKEEGERERDRERMSAGLVESGVLWHPKHGQVSLYLTACPNRFNITLAALLRFALHRVQFIHIRSRSQHTLFFCDAMGLGQRIVSYWETLTCNGVCHKFINWLLRDKWFLHHTDFRVFIIQSTSATQAI